MSSNDLTNPNKDLINGNSDKVTSKSYAFHIDKAIDLIDTSSIESTKFTNLLAQYKAKVLEQYAFLYRY